MWCGCRRPPRVPRDLLIERPVPVDRTSAIQTGTLQFQQSTEPRRRERESMYDVIVIGVGGMGSATVYQFARSGCIMADFCLGEEGRW